MYDQLAEGRTVSSIAAELGCTRRTLYRVRDWGLRKGSPEQRAAVLERRERWEEAMRMGAEALVEASLDDFSALDRVISVDGARRLPSVPEITLAAHRAKYRQWVAAKKDPERYGDRTTVALEPHGAAHLAALRGVVRGVVVDAELGAGDEEAPLALEPGGD